MSDGIFRGTWIFLRWAAVRSGGDDKLVLQYLNNQRYDYAALKAATPFGQKLIEYVRMCDPGGSGFSESRSAE
jgi:hypothetical protein